MLSGRWLQRLRWLRRKNWENEPLKPSLKSPQMRHRGVTRRYRHPERVNANTLRLRAVVALFRLSASEIARGTGFSRPYVSRCLSGNDLIPSPEFLRKLECKLGTIIDGRASQFFTIPAVPVQRAQDLSGGRRNRPSSGH